jgi:hypothetical protein
VVSIPESYREVAAGNLCDQSAYRHRVSFRAISLRFLLRLGSLLAALFFSLNAAAYSVLTHEELIDLAWNDSIRPMLLKKFPGTTETQLLEAHAYAYGGCAIQDMGYYPFGKRFFSDLTHYVRTGDFVAWMLTNARTPDEYAFAIGALSHYLGDTIGHSRAINPATAVEFPKLEKEFGPSVTYDESPHGHIRTEFAFDVGELANHDFAPPAYLRFVGFKVPRKFLEQAFIHTYGFDVHEITGPAHPALRSYRTSVRSFIPAFAQAEVVLHRHKFPAKSNSEAYKIFTERVARTNYDRHWKHAYRGPGVKAHLLAILIFIIPKIGAISDLAIKIPNAETQEWYLSSVNHTADEFHRLLHQLAEDGKDPVRLANIDLDTGDHVKRGDYFLADETYAHLLARLTSKPDRQIPADVRQNIFEYYSHPGTGDDSMAQIEKQLVTLRTMKAVNESR